MIDDLASKITIKDMKIHEDGSMIVKTTENNEMWFSPGGGVSIKHNPLQYSTDSYCDYDYDNIFKEISRRFNQQPILKHQCHGCGATLEIDYDKHIFICRYCGSTYAIGINQINA